MKTVTKQVWLCKWKGSDVEFIIDGDIKKTLDEQLMVVLSTATVEFQVSENTCPHCNGPLPEPKTDDGWIAWKGADTKPPVPFDTRVAVRFIDGYKDEGTARDYYWKFDGDACDIIAYKVLP